MLPQSRSGGGDGIHTSGYDGSQLAGGAGGARVSVGNGAGLAACAGGFVRVGAGLVAVGDCVGVSVSVGEIVGAAVEVGWDVCVGLAVAVGPGALVRVGDSAGGGGAAGARVAGADGFEASAASTMNATPPTITFRRVSFMFPSSWWFAPADSTLKFLQATSILPRPGENAVGLPQVLTEIQRIYTGLVILGVELPMAAGAKWTVPAGARVVPQNLPQRSACRDGLRAAGSTKF